MNHFDIIVVGGGMVGAAAALGLAQQGKRVAMIERAPPIPFSAEQAMDLRVSAISHTSVNLLTSLGVWKAISEMRLCPYRALETWEFSQCELRFTAAMVDLPELGFMVENRVIQLALWQACEHETNVSIFSPTDIVRFSRDESSRDKSAGHVGHVVELDNGDKLHGCWLLGADGANSRVRDYANIGVTAWDYRQHCLLINVQTELPQQDITWQWFTPQGPRAFLPLPGHHASLVWYDSPSRINNLRAMSASQLRAQVLTHFPKRLGDIDVDQHGAFPLTRRHAQRYHQDGVGLLGDAAHTINPLAGQGVNLGFKDVQALIDVVATMEEEGTGERLNDALLATYQRRRKPDNLLMQTGMDLLYGGFSVEIAPFKMLRNLGLAVANHSGPIKKQVLKYALGL